MGKGTNYWTIEEGRQVTEDGRRTIDEKFEVHALQVAEAAAVETVLKGVEFHPLLFQVFILDHGNRIRSVAVNVNLGIETALGIGEQPVDRRSLHILRCSL